MLIGPCALPMAGAATVAAAPAAATFRKRRRVEVLSLVGAVMVFSPFDADPYGPAFIYWPQDKGLRGGLARMIAMMRRFDAARKRLAGVEFIPARRGFFRSGRSVIVLIPNHDRRGGLETTPVCGSSFFYLSKP